MSEEIVPIDYTDREIPAYGFLNIRRYPWGDLPVSTGDPLKGPSFLVQRAKHEMRATWASLTSCARSIEKRRDMKFVMRREIGGIRVWRVK